MGGPFENTASGSAVFFYEEVIVMAAFGKMEQMVSLLKIAGCDAFFIAPSPDLEYICGLDCLPDERFKGLLVTNKGRFFFMTPKLYLEEMSAVAGDPSLCEVWEDHEGFVGAFINGCKKAGLESGKIAFNDAVRAVDMLKISAAMKGIVCCDGEELISPMRSVKSKEEISLLQKAAKVADDTLSEVVKHIRPGLSERQIAEKLTEIHDDLGKGICRHISHIVAAGPNAAMPHYNGCDRIMEDKDVVLIDFAGRYGGYFSDMTRTFFIGDPTEEEKNVYRIVLEAQTAGERAIRSGISAGEVDRIVRKVIEEAGYGERFPYRVGHGVGISVHETPFIKAFNKHILRPGNVFSIEPGIYLPGKFGVRIENLVAVADDGSALVLNKLPKSMLVL